MYHDHAAAAELFALHRQELAADDIVGQVQIWAIAIAANLAAIAIAHQHARPDHAMEDDIIFAHEVVVPRLWILPPLTPCVGRATVLGPLDACREVANHGVEPDIDPLVVAHGILEQRD